MEAVEVEDVNEAESEGEEDTEERIEKEVEMELEADEREKEVNEPHYVEADTDEEDYDEDDIRELSMVTYTCDIWRNLRNCVMNFSKYVCFNRMKIAIRDNGRKLNYLIVSSQKQAISK